METGQNFSGQKDVLREIRDELRDLNGKLDSQNQRISRLESVANLKSFSETETAVFPENVPAETLPPPPPPPSADFLHEGEKEPVIQPVRNEAFEEQLGGTLFARIGIVALILGVAFFLKYAFDNNWIGETGRVMLGLFGGLALLGIGEKTTRKYPAYGQVISGGGIAILYLSIFAAFNYYRLIDQFPAALFMILITAAGVALSLRYDSMPLISWAVIGGFATPFLISSGENQQFSLLSYILLLDLAILFISFIKKWRAINLLGYSGTFLVFLSWGTQFYSEDQLASTMFFLSLFFFTYSISSLAYNLAWKEKSSGIEQALSVLTATTYFIFSYILLNPNYHPFLGFFACILGLYYLIWSYAVRSLTPKDENLYNFLAVITIGFVTLAIPLQFDKNIITIGWTIEALIIFYLSLKTRQEVAKAVGLAIYALAVFRLFFIDSMMELKDPLFIFNERFFTFFFVVAMSYIAAYLFNALQEEIFEKKSVSAKQFVVLLVIAANVFTVFSVSQEIIGYYGREMNSLTKKHYEALQQKSPYAPPTSYQRQSYNPDPYQNQNNSQYQDELNSLQNGRDISLSLFWLAYAIVILFIGFAKKYKGVRIGGLLLLVLSIFKLFFYDLWSLGTLYRILSSISLGVVLLVISFAYQKYKDKLREIIA